MTTLLLAALSTPVAPTDDVVQVECEAFESLGGWVLDQQFMDLMGSPYLLAHGIGAPLATTFGTEGAQWHWQDGGLVGLAASLCARFDCDPRAVYAEHLEELFALMGRGAALGEER